jgi:hypothetical protein
MMTFPNSSTGFLVLNSMPPPHSETLAKLFSVYMYVVKAKMTLHSANDKLNSASIKICVVIEKDQEM